MTAAFVTHPFADRLAVLDAGAAAYGARGHAGSIDPMRSRGYGVIATLWPSPLEQHLPPGAPNPGSGVPNGYAPRTGGADAGRVLAATWLVRMTESGERLGGVRVNKTIHTRSGR